MSSQVYPHWFIPDLTEFPGWRSQFWVLNPKEEVTTNPRSLNKDLHLTREQARRYLYLFFPQNLTIACAYFNFPEESIRKAMSTIGGEDADPCFVLSYLYFENRWIAVALTFLPQKAFTKPSLLEIDAHDLQCLKLRDLDKTPRQLKSGGQRGAGSGEGPLVEAVNRALGSAFALLSPLKLLGLAGGSSGSQTQAPIPQQVKSWFLGESQAPNGMLISCFAEQLEVEFEQHAREAAALQDSTQGRISNSEMSAMLKKLFDVCLRDMQISRKTGRINRRFNFEVIAWIEKEIRRSRQRMPFPMEETERSSGILSPQSQTLAASRGEVLSSYPVEVTTFASSHCISFVSIQKSRREEELRAAGMTLDTKNSSFPLQFFLEKFRSWFPTALTCVVCGRLVSERPRLHSEEDHDRKEKSALDYVPRQIFVESRQKLLSTPDLFPQLVRIGEKCSGSRIQGDEEEEVKGFLSSLGGVGGSGERGAVGGSSSGSRGGGLDDEPPIDRYRRERTKLVLLFDAEDTESLNVAACIDAAFQMGLCKKEGALALGDLACKRRNFSYAWIIGKFRWPQVFNSLQSFVAFSAAFNAAKSFELLGSTPTLSTSGSGGESISTRSFPHIGEDKSRRGDQAKRDRESESTEPKEEPDEQERDEYGDLIPTLQEEAPIPGEEDDLRVEEDEGADEGTKETRSEEEAEYGALQPRDSRSFDPLFGLSPKSREPVSEAERERQLKIREEQLEKWKREEHWDPFRKAPSQPKPPILPKHQPQLKPKPKPMQPKLPHRVKVSSPPIVVGARASAASSRLGAVNVNSFAMQAQLASEIDAATATPALGKESKSGYPDPLTIYDTYIRDVIRTESNPDRLLTKGEQIRRHFKFSLRLFRNILEFLKRRLHNHIVLSRKLDEVDKDMKKFIEAKKQSGIEFSYTDVAKQFPFDSLIADLRKTISGAIETLTLRIESYKKVRKELTESKNYLDDPSPLILGLINPAEQKKLLQDPATSTFITWKGILETLFENSDWGILKLAEMGYQELAGFLAELVSSSGGETDALSLFVTNYNNIALHYTSEAAATIQPKFLECFAEVLYFIGVLDSKSAYVVEGKSFFTGGDGLSGALSSLTLRGESSGGRTWKSSGFLPCSVESLHFISDADLIQHWGSLFVFDLQRVPSLASEGVGCPRELLLFMEEFKGFYMAAVIPSKSCNKRTLVDKKSAQLAPVTFVVSPRGWKVGDLERMWYKSVETTNEIDGFSYTADHRVLESKLHAFLSALLQSGDAKLKSASKSPAPRTSASTDYITIINEFAAAFVRQVKRQLGERWKSWGEKDKQRAVEEAANKTIQSLGLWS